MRVFYLAFVLLGTALFTSCTRDIQTSNRANGKILQGVWELRDVMGGMLAYDPNNYKPGNGSLWVFTEGTFKKIYKDSVYRSGTYAISPRTGTNQNTGQKIDQFIFNNVPAESFELRNDTLRLYYGAIPADGYIELYVKITD